VCRFGISKYFGGCSATRFIRSVFFIGTFTVGPVWILEIDGMDPPFTVPKLSTTSTRAIGQEWHLAGIQRTGPFDPCSEFVDDSWSSSHTIVDPLLV
jgi:hypothetical protein